MTNAVKDVKEFGAMKLSAVRLSVSESSSPVSLLCAYLSTNTVIFNLGWGVSYSQSSVKAALTPKLPTG